jgi:tetraacyldisaccharide 4'-kinase
MPNTVTGFYVIGRPLSPLYSLIMQARSCLYTRGLCKREKMEVPVISVGNLSMGGTGKTPIVQYIARLFASNFYKPAIISRGYGGKAKDQVNIVSDGKTLLMDAIQAGDEPRLLAQSLPGIPVITGTVRSYPCRYAIDCLGATLLILDDGFQHLSRRRDVDLVLFDTSTLEQNKRVFPGGELREPFSALRRAHAFLLTGMADHHQPQVDRFCSFLKKYFPNQPVFVSSYTPSHCQGEDSSTPISLDSLPSPLHGFCGIANPSRFRETLVKSGLQLSGFTELKDHQHYSSELLKKIVGSARAAGARAMITTEKDMVKLCTLSSPLPLFSLSMTVQIQPPFSDFLLNKIASSQKS